MALPVQGWLQDAASLLYALLALTDFHLGAGSSIDSFMR